MESLTSDVYCGIVSGLWGEATGVTPYNAFIGGAMMLFGARLASGCTRLDSAYTSKNM